MPNKNFLNIDVSELEKFCKKLNKNADKAIDEFMENTTHDVTADLLANTVDNTPYRTHTLQRGWIGQTGGGSKPSSGKVKNYSESLKVKKNGSKYSVQINNRTDYAIYVELGHRTRSGHGWVKGWFMLTNAIEDTQKNIKRIVEPRLKEFYKKLL